MANPLTQVTDALWTMLEANSGFTNLVKAGNRIKYDSRNPEKHMAQSADYPIVRIKESTALAQPYRTSNMSTFSKQYHIQIITGEQAYDSCHDVEFEIIRSFADWPNNLESLAWSGDDSKFVYDCRLLTAEQMLDSKEPNQKIRGWSTVWACMVGFKFQTTALQP